MTSKKGISPLIATVLLIGFTIVAAVIVITWINTLVTDTTDDAACKAEALNICGTGGGAFEYSKTGAVGVDLKGQVLNSGLNNATFKVIYLASTGSAVGGCPVATLTVGPSNSNVTSSACTNSTVTNIKFIQEVVGTYGSATCTETCGAGETISAV